MNQYLTCICTASADIRNMLYSTLGNTSQKKQSSFRKTNEFIDLRPPKKKKKN